MRKNQPFEKSIGNETTIRKTSSYEIIRNEYVDLCESLSEEMKSKDLFGRTLTLKVKTSDFDLLTRSKSLDRKGFNENFWPECPQKHLSGTHFLVFVGIALVNGNPKTEHFLMHQRW